MSLLAFKPLSAPALRALWRHFDAGSGDRTAALLCKLARRGHKDVLAAFAGHPLEDEWRDFAWHSLTARLSPRRGIVYVAGNPVNIGLYKVGQTKTCLQNRLKTLNTAGVIGSFLPVFSLQVRDRFAVEAAAHTRLARVVPKHKEFFQCGWQTAIDALRAEAQRDERTLAALMGEPVELIDETSVLMD